MDNVFLIILLLLLRRRRRRTRLLYIHPIYGRRPVKGEYYNLVPEYVSMCILL